MEEVIDFDSWIAQQQAKKSAQYYAVYDPETGRIKGVWPEGALGDQKFCVPIELSVAESIMSGTLSPSFCYIDPDTEEFTLLDSQELGLTKIDNVLHRITEKRFSDLKNYDIHITYQSSKNILTFQLSEKYGGTFKDLNSENKKRKKVFWDFDTRLDFLLTEYNDPNIIHEFISFSMSDIIGKDQSYIELTIPKKFSIYTNRVLKDCVVEIL